MRLLEQPPRQGQGEVELVHVRDAETTQSTAIESGYHGLGVQDPQNGDCGIADQLDQPVPVAQQPAVVDLVEVPFAPSRLGGSFFQVLKFALAPIKIPVKHRIQTEIRYPARVIEGG